MLVLTRERDQIVFIDFSKMTDEELLSLRSGPPIEIHVVDIRGDKVRIGFEAPKTVQVHRKEVWQQIKAANQPRDAYQPGRGVKRSRPQ